MTLNCFEVMKTINYALKYVPVTDGNEGCEGIAFVTALHPNMAVTEQGKEAIKKALFETLKLFSVNDGKYESIWEDLCDTNHSSAYFETENGQCYEMSFVPVKYINSK